MNEADLVARYQVLRAKKNALKAEVAKYKAALDKIESYFLPRLIDSQMQNIKFETGLVYKTTLMQPKMVDRPKLIRWVQYETGPAGFDVFTNSVSKEFVQAQIEEKKAPPPGVDVTYFTKVNIRKD